MRSVLSVSLAFLALPAFAEDSYTIKLKLDADVGKTISFRSVDTASGSMKFLDGDGKLMAEQRKEGGERAYRVTVLERDKGGKVTKFVRTYDKAFEKENGKTKTFSYQGRTMLFEKLDGKYRMGVVGDPPLASKDVAELYRLMDKKDDTKGVVRYLPPGKPVKVGDSWPIPVKPVAELDDVPADLERSSITAKLTKVYAKGKSRFGTFEVALKISLSSKKDNEDTLTFDPPAVFVSNLMLDLAIDGSSTERREVGTMSLEGEGLLQSPGSKMRMVFHVKNKSLEEISAERDDKDALKAPKVTFLARPGEWIEFRSQEHGFLTKFPSKATKQASTDKNGITTTLHGVSEGTCYYSVTVLDYPADKFKLNPATAYGNMKKMSDVKESSDIKIEGLAALVLKKATKNGIITQRVLIVGQRIYVQSIEVGNGQSADLKRFFESFRLLEQPKKKE